MPSGFSPFRPRRLVTNLLLLSFLASAISGVILFFRPEGSLARWIGWSVLALDKKQWEAVHLTGVCTFLIVSLVHVWYNWRPLIGYLRRKAAALESARGLAAPSRELLAALAVMAALLTGTLVQWQPFAAMMALRTAMKDGAFATVVPPPVADADRVTLAELCARAALPEPKALKNARDRGIDVPAMSMTLAAVARANGRSPEEVYRAIVGDAGGHVAEP